MASLFKLEIFTPYRLFFSEEVEYIILKVYDGDVEILAGHTIFTAPVRTSIVKIKNKKGEIKEAFIAKGIIEVKKNKTVLLVDAANFPEEINLERALAAREEAQSTITGSSFNFANSYAREKLLRADTRIKLCKSATGVKDGETTAL